MRIEIENNLAGLDRLTRKFTDFAELHAIPDATRREMSLALDEVVSNIIRYGYHDDALHCILVSLTLEAGSIRVEIVDDAEPFNLLEAETPPTEAPLEERPIGGLGIYLVRQLMDGVDYERRGAENRLTLRKRLGSGSAR